MAGGIDDADGLSLPALSTDYWSTIPGLPSLVYHPFILFSFSPSPSTNPPTTPTSTPTSTPARRPPSDRHT
ncbi:hypothetical protein CCMSSC00406_0008599 [Pleurotus cornucopiae]|uniref:Uncharacterized protein n=1 Tax=Pleurotus cornucopiae TaxID=5321 RepID=A0ACB7IGL5_PLECO|nr:hypothetical protein CCMSSC00406_0008599 [Pleurotus cornucopiae]